VYHSENEYLRAFDAIEDDVLAHREAAQTYPELPIASATGRREASQKKKPVRDGVNQPGGDVHAAAILGDMEPDVV
jgi:hypothetical protein